MVGSTLDATLGMTVALSRESVPYSGRASRRRASITAAFGRSPPPLQPDSNKEMSMSSSCHGPSTRRRGSASSSPGVSGSPKNPVANAGLLDLKLSANNGDNGRKKARDGASVGGGGAATSSSRVKEVISLRRTQSFSLDGPPHKDPRDIQKPGSDHELEKFRGRSTKPAGRSASRKDTKVDNESDVEQHSHDDSCMDASSNCAAHARKPNKGSSNNNNKDKKDRRRRVSVSPTRDISIPSRVRRVASDNDLLDDSSRSCDPGTTRRSNSGTRLSSTKKSTKKSGTGNPCRGVNRTFSASSGSGTAKRKSSSSSKDRSFSTPKQSGSGKGLSSSRHGKSRSPTTSRTASTPRQRMSIATGRSKASATAAAAVALLANNNTLSDGDDEVAATSAVEHQLLPPSPPPRRHNPAETWICECGHELRLCMKFCGYCAKPQNWVCGECAFGENLQGFSFCGGCAAPKNLAQSLSQIRGRQQGLGTPASPQSVVADLGQK